MTDKGTCPGARRNDGLRHDIVIAVPRTADGGVDTGLSGALAIPDGNILRASVTVMVRRFPLGCQACKAYSSASRTKSVRIGRLARQPTMSREKTSTMKATYAKPSQVE